MEKDNETIKFIPVLPEIMERKVERISYNEYRITEYLTVDEMKDRGLFRFKPFVEKN